ncbi:MAG TPA: TolC family protein [Fimbriiglobus sp.]|nr:TolC family protein [Fimbriiglobus sp.]
MAQPKPRHRRSAARRIGLASAILLSVAGPAVGQAPAPSPTVPPAARTYPITLPTALQLANANPLDIAIAVERLRAATARYDRARVLWLPNVGLGVDYFRHDGQIQDIGGNVFTTSRSSFLVGGGPTLSVAVADAIYAPLAARQVVAARRSDVQAAVNDSTLAVAEAYFDVQQARGELAGATDAARRAEDLVRRTEKLAPGLAPSVEINRARTELARRRQAVEAAAERWEVASAELVRLLRLDPTTVVEPTEAPNVRVELIDPNATVDDLIPLALTHRPELASQQALVQATLARIRHEKLRPLVPSVVLRGVASNTPGLSSGYFGGGINGFVGNFGGRNSMDLQIVWQLDNLGFGNRAAVRERQAENRQALAELFRIQDRVASEVVRALAQVKRAANRMRAAGDGVRNAVETADKNLQGLGQTKRVGEQLTTIFRPQEAVAAVAALDQAYRDYYAAVADLNRAQFRLYRAVGHPAQSLAASGQPAPQSLAK